MITLMMDAVSSSETSVSFYQTTWRNIPEGSHLHIRLREKQKSHKRRDNVTPQTITETLDISREDFS
jgi:hypothetical protein